MKLTAEEKQKLFPDLLRRVEEIATASLTRQEKLDFVCNLLRNDVPYYNWVGFYLVDKAAMRALVLGPYAGAHTDHTNIAFGQGICGQAADTLQNFVVQDVSQETNYLSCSLNVKSEIVLPVFHDGKLVGELDIDSHELAPFSPEDEAFLGQVCQRVAHVL